MSHIVIIGAGQAGAALAAKLRALNHAGPITLIGEEAAPPYQRPPLSKKYLLGEMALERLYLRPPEFYAENGIELHLAETAVAVDRADRRVIAGGRAIAYDQLALTTGAVPRRLPGAIGGELAGVHVVRTLADVDAMAPDFLPGARVLIVGGGYIGLEAAAVAAMKGLEVTLVEAADRILQRVAAPETSAWFRALHRAHGVDLREGTGLVRLIGEGRVTGAELTDGTVLEVDFVIAGIGVTPATELAEVAGLATENGIAVDAMGRTSDPRIWAAGDCTSLPFRGERIRLESVQNAIDQADAVAANMLGAGVPYDPKPWFWSDQYDVKLQIAGLNTGYDRVILRAGDREGSVSHWYYRGAELLAVDAMNDPRAYMTAKRLIEAGRSPDPATVAAGDLKALMAA
ncbi:NAD(P)/FAD-dependent oxidoreductase [Rhodovulum euryhalinum]|uniref:3-phenylpropionate/trans-cinnamate dioxygenase ferredoxin reductase subunit n=1 Tax=Rhodovulum euryhalinum TaxID=35805 RepID=A0A4R2KIN8_9RHOB|nr:FAD-dependent oxidoreductase [Rhodovulum euryhalinum]TCO73503.1 3-phenylpropionate/trans-cinnamate dioxygenase ferredoxin reductase subunit [Rhodovulum euryhalinum]